MKSFPKILITYFLIFFITNNVIAQFASIDSLKIIPSNPSVNDTAKVICLATFTSGGCPLTNSLFTVSDGIIKMIVSHSLGVLTLICHSTDTLKIGKLNAGKYKLIYTLAANSVTYDIDTLSFTVQQTVGIEFQPCLDEKIKIYPNQAVNNITISANRMLSSETMIKIFSTSG